MPQQNLFPLEVHHGDKTQRTPNNRKVNQPSARSAPQGGANRQTAEPQGRAGYSAPTSQPYQQPRNQSAAVAPAARSAFSDDGRVRLFGWIGRYFEVKRTQSGVLRATFSVATPKTYKDPSGNSVKKTVWQRIVVWGEPARPLERQLQTGARVHVEGKFKTREWTDSENILHTTTELVARNIRFLDMEENGMVA